MNNKYVKNIIHYGLLVVIILYILTGLGITQNRIIGPLTFEMLSKPNASLIHTYLIYPLIVFLYIHIVITFEKRRKIKKNKKKVSSKNNSGK